MALVPFPGPQQPGALGTGPDDEPEDDPARNPCGQGLGRYDDPLANGSDDRLRRVVVMNVIVADPYAAS